MPPIVSARLATATPSRTAPTASEMWIRAIVHWATAVRTTAATPTPAQRATIEVERRWARVRVTSTHARIVMAVTWLAG